MGQYSEPDCFMNISSAYFTLINTHNTYARQIRACLLREYELWISVGIRILDTRKLHFCLSSFVMVIWLLRTNGIQKFRPLDYRTALELNTRVTRQAWSSVGQNLNSGHFFLDFSSDAPLFIYYSKLINHFRTCHNLTSEKFLESGIFPVDCRKAQCKICKRNIFCRNADQLQRHLVKFLFL